MNPDQKLEKVVRTISLTDMVRYAGATWDWHQLHYDADFLESIGLDLSLIHISEPTRHICLSRMPSSA